VKSFNINSLPFYWRLCGRHDSDNYLGKTNFPFTFEIDPLCNLLVQARNEEVLSALGIVYEQEYNIGYLQDRNVIAKQYGVDFLKFLKAHLFLNPKVKNILEIGCGGCVVLSELKTLGYEVMGIDSSPFAKSEGQKKGVDVIQGFFPGVDIKNKFDLIFHVDVLEHIDDYIGFLRSQYDQLNEDGLLVVNVPDASESIGLGDFSIAMHQHLNYFSENSLRQVLNVTGFHVTELTRAGYGGSLYAIATKSLPAHGSRHAPPFTEEFFVNALLLRNRFVKLVQSIESIDNSSLGFYVPLRALPYISNLESDLKFRFFDDTPHWHNQYFDGVNICIENFSDLVKSPVTHLFVMSLTFGETIKKKVKTYFGDSMQIITLKEIASS
jgi:2-polyprenyl-3-methyl-5-hydroxy-6-metoxy-1,4-benzoquinol methylase